MFNYLWEVWNKPTLQCSFVDELVMLGTLFVLVALAYGFVAWVQWRLKPKAIPPRPGPKKS